MRGLGDPPLLRRHVCGRKHLLCRIDQEENKDPAVTRSGGILQSERLEPVLIQVRECDASLCFGDHIADTLHTRDAPDTHVPQFTGPGRR